MKRKIPYHIYFIILILLATKNIAGQDITHLSQNKSSFHGSLSTIGMFYHSSGLTPRKLPFSYVISGNFTLNLKGFIFPFSFTYSDRNKSFRQPFNQFGISPKYKWITLHLGYRNINFSPYVLGGHTILGAGIELNPGLFRFGFVYGRLRRTTNQAQNVNNPLNDTLTSFNRKVLSFKIGVGNNNNYFDLIFLRAADDSTSLDSVAKEGGTFPAANVVAGIKSHISFSHTLHLTMEAAYSIYTVNQNSTISIDAPAYVRKIIPINISSQGYLAVKGLLEYRSRKGLKLGLGYRRIDPGYQTMGSYFITNDLENITFRTSFQALKRKLRFSGSFGVERNNLNLARNATTRKIIGSALLSYDPSRIFGITTNYANYSINQQAGRIQIADSVKLYQTNGTLMVMPHFQFLSKNKKLSQFVSLVFTRLKLNDKNPNTGSVNSFTTTNNILTYSITFVPVVFSVQAGLNYNQINMSVGNSTNLGATLGLTKGFLKNKISLGLSANFTQSKNDQQTLLVFTPAFTGQAKFGKHHHIRLHANIISTNNKSTELSTTEEIGDLSYVFTF